MLKRISGIFAPPVFPDDEEKTRQARVLNTLLLSTMLIALFVIGIAIPLFFAEKLFNSLTILVLLLTMGLEYWWMRRGRLRLASALFLASYWIIFTIFLLFSGGIQSGIIVFYVAGTVVAGLLVGTRGATIYIAACSLAGLGMVFLEASGHPLPRIFPVLPLVAWLDMAIALVTVLTVMNLATRSLNEALALTRQRLEERKRAEEAVRKSEEKFRALFETSRDFLYVTNMEGNIIDVNKAAGEMSGYSVDELKKINITELYNDVAEREILVNTIVQRGFVENYEIKGKKKDGTIVDALVNSTAIRDEDGSVVGFQGSLKDISERKQAEEALRASEARYRGLLENIPAIIYIIGVGQEPVNPTTFTSLYMEKLLGYTQAEFYNDPLFWANLVHPDDRERVHAESERADQTGEPFVSDYRIISKEHKTIWFYDESVLVKDDHGQPLYRLGVCTDITERKQAEEARRESEERFSRLSALTIEGIGISVQGKVVDANPQLTRMLGYEAGELIGMNAVDLVAPESRELVMKHMKAGFEGPYEHLSIRKDGSIFPVEIRARSITYGGQQARVTIIRDITEHKQAEEAMGRQMERLRALHSIEQAILSSMDLNMILKLLVQEVVNQLHVDAADVLLFDPETNKLDFASGAGFRTKALRYTNLDIGSGLAGQAALERKTVHIVNLAEFNKNPTLSKAISGEEFSTYYGVPLIAKDQLHGVLEIFHRTTLAPDPDWLRFLEALAGQAAISIDNARLLETTQQSLKETNALYRINQDLVASIEAEQLANHVVDLLQKNFNYHYVQIFTVDPENGDFVMRAGSGKIGKRLMRRGYRLAPGEGIVGYTAETGNAFFSNDVDQVISFVRPPFLRDTKSELAVPIKVGDQFLGLLDIHQVPPASLTQRDVQLVSAVANQLALALQKALLYADLQDALHKEQATRSQLIQSERLAVAGRLLASVSHELNNPLQVIQNVLYLLKDEAGISPQGKQDLSIVLSETERMATLLERLRTTYRPLQAEEFQSVQINDLIEDVHALVATHLRHNQVAYEFRANPELPPIAGLSDQLRQVILNLFMNAAESMTDGGRLIVSTDSLVANRQILITVTDTGPGIEAAILPNIFEAFVSNKKTGTGLGLTIAYEIVRKHGGQIHAENNPDSGATFKVWLPVGNGDGE